MAILTMNVRRNPLTACPVPPPPPAAPPIVGLHYDPAGPPPTVLRIYIRLISTHLPEQVSGTYRLSTRTANIDVGSGRWADLSSCLGSQPFLATFSTTAGDTADLETVNGLDCFLPAGTVPIARIANPGPSNLGRDVFAMRREVSAIRSLAADVLTELSEINTTLRRERDFHAHNPGQHDSQRVPRGEFENVFSEEADDLTGHARGR